MKSKKGRSRLDSAIFKQQIHLLTDRHLPLDLKGVNQWSHGSILTLTRPTLGKSRALSGMYKAVKRLDNLMVSTCHRQPSNSVRPIVHMLEKERAVVEVEVVVALTYLTADKVIRPNRAQWSAVLIEFVVPYLLSSTAKFPSTDQYRGNVSLLCHLGNDLYSCL